MRDYGNSDVDVCAANLLSMMQREGCYARSKGLDGDALGLPPDIAEGYIDESARDCLEVYEPRVDLDEIDFEIATGDGVLPYDVTLVDAEDEEDD